ncbi:hypothetical protein V6N13_064136 [Hibiscus sabdariffa]|uniref:Uncharacterized protein n=1 Tax=Hibiscus sabdariffa TaxID=183260 RepID=A0ABR2R2I7_9ROSI
MSNMLGCKPLECMDIGESKPHVYIISIFLVVPSVLLSPPPLSLLTGQTKTDWEDQSACPGYSTHNSNHKKRSITHLHPHPATPPSQGILNMFALLKHLYLDVTLNIQRACDHLKNQNHDM